MPSPAVLRALARLEQSLETGELYEGQQVVKTVYWRLRQGPASQLQLQLQLQLQPHRCLSRSGLQVAQAARGQLRPAAGGRQGAAALGAGGAAGWPRAQGARAARRLTYARAGQLRRGAGRAARAGAVR